MIVFWRLFLAFFLTDFVLFNHTGEKAFVRSRTKGLLLHGGVFLLLGLGLCYGYLTMPWPFLELINLPGWMCIVLFALFHVFSDEFFQFGGKFRHGYVVTFFVKTFVNHVHLLRQWLIHCIKDNALLCTPFHGIF